jgi:hypothetical protein
VSCHLEVPSASTPFPHVAFHSPLQSCFRPVPSHPPRRCVPSRLTIVIGGQQSRSECDGRDYLFTIYPLTSLGRRADAIDEPWTRVRSIVTKKAPLAFLSSTETTNSIYISNIQPHFLHHPSALGPARQRPNLAAISIFDPMFGNLSL